MCGLRIPGELQNFEICWLLEANGIQAVSAVRLAYVFKRFGFKGKLSNDLFFFACFLFSTEINGVSISHISSKIIEVLVTNILGINGEGEASSNTHWWLHICDNVWILWNCLRNFSAFALQSNGKQICKCVMQRNITPEQLSPSTEERSFEFTLG